VLRDVNPMVIRVVEISDQLRLAEFHDIFRTILGWLAIWDTSYNGLEFNSFRPNTRSEALHEFHLHREDSSYTSATRLHLWQ
jgi:hypothetical protein